MGIKKNKKKPKQIIIDDNKLVVWILIASIVWTMVFALITAWEVYQMKQIVMLHLLIWFIGIVSLYAGYRKLVIFYIYEYIISATSDHMSFINQDYIYCAVNDAYLRAHKKVKEEIVGHSVSELLGEDIFKKLVKEKLDRCLAGEEIHYQDWFDFPESGRCYMDVAYYPYIGTSGTISGVVVASRDITRQKQVEDNLRESEERYKALFMNMGSGVAIFKVQGDAEDFIFTDFNKAAEKIDNQKKEELIGKSIFKARPQVEEFGLVDVFREVWRTGKAKHHPITIYKDKKLNAWYENFVYKLPSGEIVTLFTNETDQKQVEEELKLRQIQLKTILNNLDAIIYISDMESYETLFMNDYMKELLGNDFTGHICWESFHDNLDGPCEFCTNEKLIDLDGNSAGPCIWEFYNQKVNKFYELHDQAIPWTGGRLVRMEIGIDITDRKFAEKAILQREQYLNVLNNAAQLLLGSADIVPFQEFVDEIGPASNASRIYIFINHPGPEDYLMTSQKAEWCAKGITPEINNPKLQNLSHEDWMPRWIKTLTQGNVIKGRVEDFPENEREILEPQGILAIMIMPIIIEDKFVGFIGFDNCESDREWEITEEVFLSMAANDLAQAAKRVRFQEQMHDSLVEKDTLLREIHHRVKNNMQVIVSLLRMHGRRTKDKQLGEIFDDCRDRINAMSLIHESLYQSDNLANIDFGIYLKKLCHNLSQVYDASGKGIDVNVKQSKVTLDMDQGIAVGMVISELVSNAFKHAFPLDLGGSVMVSLSDFEENGVELIIKDDGKGIPPEIDIFNTSSLGLKLAVAAVTRELNGSIEVERNKGTCFIIHF